MNPTLKLSLTSAAVLAISAVSGFAQTSTRVAVKVPFEFVAGNVTLPAGQYNFQEDRTGVVFISSAETRKSVVVLTNAETTAMESGQPTLKFDRVNGAYTLSEIDMVGEPGRRVVRLDSAAATRPASLGSRTSSGAATKSFAK